MLACSSTRSTLFTINFAHRCPCWRIVWASHWILPAKSRQATFLLKIHIQSRSALFRIRHLLTKLGDIVKGTDALYDRLRCHECLHDKCDDACEVRILLRSSSFIRKHAENGIHERGCWVYLMIQQVYAQRLGPPQTRKLQNKAEIRQLETWISSCISRSRLVE